MKYQAVLILLAVLLVSCGGAPAAPTGQSVLDKFKAAGIAITPATPAGGDAIPKSYLERMSFTIDSIAPAGGQVFICDTKKNCDAIYAYFDALKALAGPYLYQSPGGTVVAQLNSGLSPTEATKFDQVIQSLP
jgi:hypothetical protein